MTVIWGTRRGGLFEMIGTLEFVSTIVSTDTLTWRVIGDDDMTGYGGAMTIEIFHMAVSIIAQLSGQRVAEGDRLGHLGFLRRLRVDGGRHGHTVGDAAWGIRSVQPRAVDTDLMQ
jgi:hypothetical protein